jgi:isopenicillin-N N-acyltransferase-like protein
VTLPLLHLDGSPYEQGIQHGRALRDFIAHNLDLYFFRFSREARLSSGDVLARAMRYLSAISTQNADYFDGLRGVADGSGFTLEQIAALNVRYELMYYELGRIAMAEGCTAFAVTPAASANGHLLLGQNWDWIPGVRCALLHTVEPSGLQTLSLTEAGIVGGKIGLNSAGIGLAINGLTTTDDDWSRLSKPFHLRCYEILRSDDLDRASRVVTDTPRACSSNFLLAQIPDRIVDVEAAPDQVHLLTCAFGNLVHTNHFVDPTVIGIVETASELGPDSYDRLVRLERLLDTRRTVAVDDLMRYLGDHDGYPNSICRHEDPRDPPDEPYATVASVVMDLIDRVMLVADGQPCLAPYQRVAIN